MPICSLLVQHDLSSGGSSVKGARVVPGDAGTDVGCVSVGDDVSHIGHVSGVLGPDGVGGDKREGAGKIVLRALAAREGCCRASSARILVRVRVVDMMDGWMDGWIGDLIATVDTSSSAS